MSDDVIIRAGCSSDGFRAGQVSVMVAGTFTKEDVEDVLDLLEMVKRSVERQAALKWSIEEETK